LEVRIEDEAAAKRVLHENYCKTTGLSGLEHQSLPAADACPACGAPIQPGQRQCQDCGITLA
jgi:predicted amidophosphoribosyltransferase